MGLYETVRDYFSGRKVRDMNCEVRTIEGSQHQGFFGRIFHQEKPTPYNGPTSEEIQELFGDALESTRKLHHGFPWEQSYIPHPPIGPSRN